MLVLVNIIVTIGNFVSIHYSRDLNIIIGAEFNGERTTPKLVKETLRTNYWSLVRVRKTIILLKVCKLIKFLHLKLTETFLPVLRPGGRIINLVSGYGRLIHIPSETLRKQFSNPE